MKVFGELYRIFQRPRINTLYKDASPNPTLPDGYLPDNFFSAISNTIKSNPETHYPLIVEELTRFHSCICSTEEFATYVSETLPRGDYYLYPGGAQSRAVFEHLQKSGTANIIGLIDRDEKFLPDIDQTTIPLSSEIIKASTTLIIVCHLHIEPQLIEHLISQGISDDRIIGVTTRSGFYDHWRKTDSFHEQCQNIDSFIETLEGQHSGHLILDPRLSAQLTRPELISILGPKTIRCSFSDHFELLESSGGFIDLLIPYSVDALFELVARLNIHTVYCAQLICDNFLAMLIKHRFPEVCVIQEVYDWSNLYPAKLVCETYNMDLCQLHLLRISEMYAVTHCDAIVSKRRGVSFETFIEQITVPYFLYYHGFSDNDQSVLEKPATPSRATTSIVYAGPVPKPGNTADYHRQHFLHYFDAIYKSVQLELTIFAANHTIENGADFSMLRSRYAPRYNIGVSLDDLMEKIQTFDYGLLALNLPDAAKEVPDIRLVTSARAVTYLAAGLPVIIDDTWNAIVDLIAEFDAGIILKEPDPESIAAKIAGQTNPAQHKIGALRLREYLLEQNKSTVSHLKALIHNY